MLSRLPLVRCLLVEQEEQAVDQHQVGLAVLRLLPQLLQCLAVTLTGLDSSDSQQAAQAAGQAADPQAASVLLVQEDGAWQFAGDGSRGDFKPPWAQIPELQAREGQCTMPWGTKQAARRVAAPGAEELKRKVIYFVKKDLKK